MSGLFDIIKAYFGAPILPPASAPPELRAPMPEAIPAAPSPIGPLTRLFRVAEIVPARLQEVGHVGSTLLAHRAVYEAVGLGVPWYVVGVIHYREASGSFSRHLHNGDPLSARTVHVPSGRPEHGNPPFTWLDSARDALSFDKLANLPSWTLEETLDRLERYNGLGYRNKKLPSPYLWGATTVQQSGKYTSDGTFVWDQMDKQVGCAAIIKWLEAEGHVKL